MSKLIKRVKRYLKEKPFTTLDFGSPWKTASRARDKGERKRSVDDEQIGEG